MPGRVGGGVRVAGAGRTRSPPDPAADARTSPGVPGMAPLNSILAGSLTHSNLNSSNTCSIIGCMGAALAQVTPLLAEQREGRERREGPERRDGPERRKGPERRGGLVTLLADGAVRSGRDVSPGSGVLPDTDLLPVLPALGELLPLGALQRGSVVAAGGWSMLCTA